MRSPGRAISLAPGRAALTRCESEQVLFLDSASLEDAGRAARLPFVGGLSFNPTLLHRALGCRRISHADFRRHLSAIGAILPGTLFVQTLSHDTDGILADAHEILETVQPSRVVIKIPYSEAGLAATARLQREAIETCTTSIYTPLQAYVAATSGAAWIAPYCNRITQAGGDGVAAVRDMGEIFRRHGLACQMLVASIKSLNEMEAVVGTGARHVTVPLPLLEEAACHAGSEAAAARFREDLDWATDLLGDRRDQQQREMSS